MKLRAFLWFWSALWTFGLPLILGYLWVRGRKDPLYARHVGERLGRYPTPLQGAVWVHAVSLGEVRSAVPLIRALGASGEKVVVTTFTPAGRREAEQVFIAERTAGQVAVVWVPLETAWAFAGFFRAFRPKLGLVMEIEIWPRMIAAAAAKSVPLFMCNAQYPTPSMARDAKGTLRHAMMRGFAGALVKSDLQAQRFASVGVRNITVTGELRFDQPIPPALVAAGQSARAGLARGRRVVTFASAVEGEDDLYLDAIEMLLRADPKPFVVYVPRKPERFDDVAAMIAARSIAMVRRTSALNAAFEVRGPVNADLLLGDSLGEMYAYLAMADRAVTGGGFTPHGAHNIIEPLAIGLPVIVGPQIHTIEYPATEAIASGVCLRVETGAALQAALAPGGWHGPSDAAIQAFLAAHSGATARTMAAIARYLTSPKTRHPH
jgi:3-deoxy-D-manno-octulosonic-acid transferase